MTVSERRHSVAAPFYAALLVLSVSGAALAAPQVYTDTLSVNDPTAEAIEGGRPECGQIVYRSSAPFQVSESGNFNVFDAHSIWGTALCVGIYNGSFNPANVAQNRIAAFDGAQQINLQAGQDYVAVAQPLCFQDGFSPDPGPFAVGIAPVTPASAAEASGASFAAAPTYTTEVLDGSEPVADIGFGPKAYETIGPFQVPESRRYFYGDVGLFFDVDIQVAVYNAPPDPNNPGVNRLFISDDIGVFELQAGQDYYLLVAPFFSGDTGRWMFSLAPTADFFLNALLAGSWFNANFPGQGFFLDVFPNFGLVFLAWFTFDNKAPVDPNEANVGYSGSRWLTAFGPYEGASADLAIELTTEGRFVDPAPVMQDLDYGSISLDFVDCNNANITYNIPSAGESGDMAITRIATDNVPLCEDAVAVPGELLTQ